MKNIHVLPTGKPSIPSRLFYNEQESLIFSKKYSVFNGVNIYITDDSEIKEGDYILVFGKVTKCFKVNYNSVFWEDKFSHIENCKKIILTTDHDLIKNGIQAIDDEFLQWFVKNPSCEEVEIYEVGGKLFAEPIIPKEEPKQEFPQFGTKEFNDLASTYFGGKPKQETLEEKLYKIVSKEPSKFWKESDERFRLKETVEEVAEIEFPLVDTEWCRTGAAEEENLHLLGHRKSFIKGAKWQQEQDKKMYSEEDLRTAYFSGIKTTGEGWNGEYANGNNPSIEEEFQEGFQEWLRQFKNK
jgi:hypothetical protein